MKELINVDILWGQNIFRPYIFSVRYQEFSHPLPISATDRKSSTQHYSKIILIRLGVEAAVSLLLTVL